MSDQSERVHKFQTLSNDVITQNITVHSKLLCSLLWRSLRSGTRLDFIRYHPQLLEGER